MAKGKTCPLCRTNTLQKKDSFYECTNDECGFIGWGIQDKISKVGKGSGVYCPNCGSQTLHGLYGLEDGSRIFRCTTCYYAGIG